MLKTSSIIPISKILYINVLLRHIYKHTHTLTHTDTHTDIYIYIYSEVMKTIQYTHPPHLDTGIVTTCRVWTTNRGFHSLLLLEPTKCSPKTVLSSQRFCGNLCTCAHDVRLNIAGTNEAKNSQQSKQEA